MICIFDIDGTLVHRNHDRPSLKQKAFTAALEEVFGFSGINYMDYPVFGETDRSIYRMVLRSLGISQNDIAREETAFLHRFVEIFEELSQRNPPEYSPLQGVTRLLKTLNAMSVPLGIATGNLEAIAKRKLDDAGIDTFFSFGAFGETSPDRTRIVGKAVEIAPGSGPFVLFGDTPRDIHAAHAAGIFAAAVATGRFSIELLKSHTSAKDIVFPELTGTERVVAYLLNCSQTKR